MQARRPSPLNNLLLAALPWDEYHLLLRYTQALMAQIAQTAVCNQRHPVERRLCRLVLCCLGRPPSRSRPVPLVQLPETCGG
jgi:hypothetical protein